MILAGQHIPTSYLTQIRAWGHEVILLPPSPRLPAPVASHPDMLLFHTNDILITDRAYYTEHAKAELDSICQYSGLTLQLTDDTISSCYPEDIRFNALPVGKYLFCHATHISSAIRDWANRNECIILPTKQGYARCSACPVGENALITADPSIAAKAAEKGLDVCLIRQGHILLPGYSYGFIGGCCGFCEKELFFCGDLNQHPDGARMISFITAHGWSVQMIPTLPLLDVGSLFFIPANNPT